MMRAVETREASAPADASVRGTKPFLAEATAMRETLKRLLARSAAPWVIIALAVALSIPSLGTGFVADDYIHELMMREHPGIEGYAFRPFDLFAFANGDSARTHQLMDEGVFPRWTDPSVVLSFFRPIASATHYLD